MQIHLKVEFNVSPLDCTDRNFFLNTPMQTIYSNNAGTGHDGINMRKAKTVKIFLDDSGSFLGRGKGCLIVRDRKGKVEEYPLFENEIGEVHVRIGNSVSSGALATCAFWGIDLLILTQRGNPVAYLKSLDYDSHVKTRICQYEAMKNGKGIEIAKKIVLSRIEGQNQILRKYGLRQHDLVKARETISRVQSDKLSVVRKRLLGIE